MALKRHSSMRTSKPLAMKQQKRNVPTAIAYAREGALSKACQALTNVGLAPDTPDTWNLLKLKHPEGPVPTPPTALDDPAVLPVDFNLLQALRSFPKCTAAGPSGMWIQHLIDVSSAPLPTPFLSTLKQLVNHLAAGKAPKEVSRFLAGATLVALPKQKPNCPPDVCPIAVGEVLRRLTGKCLYQLLKSKAMDFFLPYQFGVACPNGAEKVIHTVRQCIDNHWTDDGFVLLKVDLTNAFNLVSRTIDAN